MRYEIEIRDTHGNVLQRGTEEADTPATAALKLHRRLPGHSRDGIGLVEHFSGGDTYHIQWGRSLSDGRTTNLQATQVLHITKREET